jgi:hypothetical protein
MGAGGAASLTAPRSSVAARQLRRSATLVDENKLFQIKVKAAFKPSLSGQPHILALLFGRVGSLFL